MPIMNPSQYDCDRMEIGDVVVIKSRSPLYKFIRKHFHKDKLKIKVRDGWTEPIKYRIEYQEDCTLMYAWDIACLKKYENCVPCAISKDPKDIGRKVKLLKSLNIGLYNVQIVFQDNTTLTLPTTWFDQGIKYNETTLRDIKDDRMLQETLRFSNIKGQTFKNIVLNDEIKEWIPSYCNICGKPVIFKFNEKPDKVVIDNQCSCGVTKLKMKELSYDEFSLWYLTQLNEDIKNIYKKFWFDREM